MNNNIKSAPDNATVEVNSIPLSDEKAKNEKKQSILNTYKFSIPPNLYHQNSSNFSNFNKDGEFKSNESKWNEKSNKKWTNEFQSFVLLSSIHFKIPLSIPCFTWIPEKEVSKLASVNDNAPLYLVGINPSYDIKSSNKKWDQVDKLQLEFAKFYKETFVEKHDYKKIKNDLKTFQTLACIKQQRSNGAITLLSAVTYQMGPNNRLLCQIKIIMATLDLAEDLGLEI